MKSRKKQFAKGRNGGQDYKIKYFELQRFILLKI